MSNNQILNEMEFEKRITEMSDRSLMEFTARQVYEVVLSNDRHEKRITTLENRDRKFFGTIGGLGGVIGAGIVAAINHFLKLK